MHVCVFLCVRACICIRVGVLTVSCMYYCAYVCMRECKCVYKLGVCVCVYVFVSVCMCVCLCLCVCVCVCLCISVSMSEQVMRCAWVIVTEVIKLLTMNECLYRFLKQFSEISKLNQSYSLKYNTI